MSIIGTFKKTANNGFNGEIATLTIQAREVRIVPEASSRASDNIPSHRVYAGRMDYE